jgi:hypothetical protein
MGTSKSSDQGKYVAGASIFSGRPDPTWTVSESLADRLISIWDLLEASTGTIPQAPPLGYRGCTLKDIDGKREWHAYNGVVTLKSPSTEEVRRDRSRKFEAVCLRSAPEGMIPPAILDSEGL